MKYIACLLLAAAVIPSAAHGSEIIVTFSNDGILNQMSVGGDDAPEDVVKRYLHAAKGINTTTDLKNASVQILKDDGRLPYRRVEVNGVSTTDKTSIKLPGMFDKQLKMSYQNDPESSWKIVRWGATLTRFVHDVYSAVRDMNGQPTEHAKEILAPIMGRQMDELVAHSWGTEAVYAAILSGFIPPPKKLILVGIPEENYAQWKILSKFTGTEVHVVGFSDDKIQITGNIMDQFVTGLPRDQDKLEALWRHRCAQKTKCVNPETSGGSLEYEVNAVRPREDAMWPAEPLGLHTKVYELPGLDHDRMDYYKWLARRGLLNKTIAQLDRFDESQKKLLKDQEDAILAQAADAATGLIDRARALGEDEAAHPEHFDPVQFPPLVSAAAAEGGSHLEPARESPCIAVSGSGGYVSCPPALPASAATASSTSFLPAVAAAADDLIADLHDLAVSACDPGESLSVRGLTAVGWYEIYGFETAGDNAVARSESVSAQLSGCEKRVFDRTVEFLRRPGSRRADFGNSNQLVAMINDFRTESSSAQVGASGGTLPSIRGNDRTPARSGASERPNYDGWNRNMKAIEDRTRESLDRLYAQSKADFERRKREQEAAQNIQRSGTGATRNK